MNIRNVLLFLFLLPIISMSSLYASMFSEDTIGKDYWNKLSEKEKTIFLMGYRHGKGLLPPEKPKDEIKVPVCLAASDFPDMIKRIDKFYEDKDNKDVRLHGAIVIVFWQKYNVPEKVVDEKIKNEREMIITSF